MQYYGFSYSGSFGLFRQFEQNQRRPHKYHRPTFHNL